MDIDQRSAEVLAADLVVDMAEDHSLDRIDWELERLDGVDSPDTVVDFEEDSRDSGSLDKAADSVADIQDSVDKAFAVEAESVDLDSAVAARAVHFVLAVVVAAVAELVSLDRRLVVASTASLELMLAVDRADVEHDSLALAMRWAAADCSASELDSIELAMCSMAFGRASMECPVVLVALVEDSAMEELAVAVGRAVAADLVDLDLIAADQAVAVVDLGLD